MSRRGLMLAELLVAGLLTAVVVGFGLGALLALQRSGQQQVEATARNHTLLGTARLLRAELAGVTPATGDLAGLAPDRFAYRAVRGTGMVCGIAADGLLVEAMTLRALRLPSPARDSILWLSAAGDSLEWVGTPVTALPRTGACSTTGAAALLIPTLATDLARALVPGPIVVTEVVEVRAYQSGSDWWLGVRSVSAGEGIQPAAGPFSPGGVAFEYFDLAGNPAGQAAAVARIRIRLRARSSVLQGVGAGARAWRSGTVDSLTLEIPLRGVSP